MADKNIDLDKILSESFSRLDKIGAGAKPEDDKVDLSQVSFAGSEKNEEDKPSEPIEIEAARETAEDAVSETFEADAADDGGAYIDDNADIEPDSIADEEDYPVEDYSTADDGMQDDGGDDGVPNDGDDDYDDEYDDDYDEDGEYDDDETYEDGEAYEDDDFVEEYKDISRRGLQFNMDREEKPKKRKKKKVRAKPNNSIFVGTLVAVIVIAISFILSFLSIQFGVEYIGLTRSDESITFDVPTGTNADTIANLLYQKGIIENPTLFKVVMKVSGKTNIVPGSITLSPNMTYPSIISELNRSRKVYETVTVTFTEGISLYRAAKLLEEKEVCLAADFLEAFNSDSGFDFEKDLELTPQTLYMMEGFMFPDTYEFYVEDDPENVASKIKTNFANKMDADKMALVDKSGLSLYEVITLASIVQAEADTPENMKLVASVFLNRLEDKAQFPNLQSDATYFYVTNTIASALGNAAVSSYEYLYSTYSCYGLPIGPIGNPGMDAINAVLQPAATDYYYFVTDSVTGEFYYASTYEEHQENVKKAGY